MHDFLKCGVNASRPAHHWWGLVFLGHRNIAGAHVILLSELTAPLENAVNEREVFFRDPLRIPFVPIPAQSHNDDIL